MHNASIQTAPIVIHVDLLVSIPEFFLPCRQKRLRKPKPAEPFTAKLQNRQNWNRIENCIRRPSLVDVTFPNVVLVCLPLASNCAVVFTALNCVWLSALYISQRNWNSFFPSPMGKFLK